MVCCSQMQVIEVNIGKAERDLVACFIEEVSQNDLMIPSGLKFYE